ncbi:MAG TPA: hypothetical protein VFU75_05590, partial [Gemmatimonadales bacterium]|nr:hypothetical protein [Gemmatimonadales bacterium]
EKTKIAEAVPATRVAAAGKEKKSLMVPVAVGVVVVALGGGAWAVFGPGHNAPPLATQHDTTTHQVAANPGRDTTQMSHADTTTKAPKNPGTHPANPANKSPGPAALDSATLAGIAERLLDMSSRAIIDSGQLVFNGAHVSPLDRSTSACAVALAYQQGGRRTEAVQWANKGLSIDPTLSSCKNVLNPGGQ